MTNNVSIKLGESAASFIKRYPNAKVVRQPAGLDFYSIHWSKPPRGVVTIDRGRNSIVINEVFSINTSEDQAEFKREGFFEYSINAGVTAPELISHDEARLKIHAILRDIMNAGWTVTVPRSSPRLKGQARLDYLLNVSSSIQLDPTYVPNLDEWMRIEHHLGWIFHADGVYLEVTFAREPTLTDPVRPGAYLLTYNLKTEVEYFRGYAGPDNRLRWKDVLPQELVKVAALRTAKEAKLREQGVSIDESYQDPPVPPLN